MTNIGHLNRRVVLQDISRSPDGSGGAETAWVNIAELWAKIRSRHGNENLNADGLTSTATHTVTIRFFASLTPDMRFVLDQRIFEIISIANLNEAHFWHVCACREVLGDAV